MWLLGYLNNPEATAAALDGDGWMRTGDLGHYDEDQAFFITGRLKEIIKYRGFQVLWADGSILQLEMKSTVRWTRNRDGPN